MVHDLLTLQAYFEAFKDTLGIKDVCWGNTDDILNRKSKIIRYPCLWVELMDETDDADDMPEFAVRLTLQQQTGNDPRDKDRITLNTLRNTLKKVVKTMRDTHSPNQINFFPQKVTYFFKEAFAGDNELLVGCELRIGGAKMCD